MQKQLSQAAAFEVSWEVCNKVGGIYTVVSSKAMQAVEFFDDRYYMLGPDFGNNAEFEETDEPCWEPIRASLAIKNYQCRFGRWNIAGRPKVILVSFKDRLNTDQLLYELWTRYGVDSMTGGYDYIEPVMFSTICGEIISTIYEETIAPEGHKAVALFHEWMCGAGLLAVKSSSPNIGTVFTTHATMLGRALAGTGHDIYNQMHQINPRREAATHNITAKCSMERVAAREADCFTTVSQITAIEAAVFLGRPPDVVTLNGLDMRVIPDYTEDNKEALGYRKQLIDSVQKLLRRKLPEKTRFIMVSGRYEFHNKGLDVFLEALAGMNEALRGTDNQVIALFCVMGGHTGVNPDAVSGDDSKKPPRGEHWITSHHVYDSPNDPIINSCLRLGLTNGPENNVQVIFNPAQLNGKDGFINLTYEQTLSACDLGMFPSWYEPWGYTPQESAAWSVPTVTTDLSGFGLWTRQIQAQEGISGGVYVVPRKHRTRAQVLTDLREVTLKAICLPEDKLLKSRKAARNLTNYFSWQKFFPYYQEAYTHALEKVAERNDEVFLFTDQVKRSFKATSSVTPVLRSFMSISYLPSRLKRLRELAGNLWWCWQAEGWDLFSTIDPHLWESCEHNPVALLANASSARLTELSSDEAYLQKMDTVLEHFDNYMAQPTKVIDENLSKEHPVAYFSTEYGICESLPIYSGGLGVLSGDHLKSASDLNIPLVAVGLLYKNGYFRQQLTQDGGQHAVYTENDFSTMAVERVLRHDKTPMEVSIDLPGRKLFAQTWVVKVGRIKLYLLDTDIPANTPEDRKTTARLYVGDRDCRLRQEILLGMGGVRLLKQLGITPSVFHMNEGHSAFLVLERIRDLMQHGQSFAVASEAVSGSCVFTTHTPVDAGNERFAPELVERYFTDYAKSIGISMQEFLDMARIVGTNRNMYEMTVLALNFSHKANGVSRLHGDVSRNMWSAGWKGYSPSEVPIGSVTNGVHVASYVSPRMRELLDSTLEPGWADLPESSDIWNRISHIPSQKIWDIKRGEKGKLLHAVEKGLENIFKTMDVSADKRKIMRDGLTNPNALVIGFARRFAPYKRANLLFAEPERLERLLKNPERPVIFIFAGKAHPADQHGIDIMREIVKYTLDPRFIGHIYFMENYSLAVSRMLTRGCDVWLNTPCRPNEASGTSGMKPSVNGGLNLSISDGWWCEGYHKDNGWTIGPVVTRLDDLDNQPDYADAESLYATLEDSVIPLYFNRDEHGLPNGWLDYSRNAMRTLTPEFSSHRMVNDYIKDYYMPTAARQKVLFDNELALTKKLVDWKHSIAHKFPGVSIDEVVFEGIDSDTLYVGQKIRINVTINPGELNDVDLRVELVVGRTDDHDFVEAPRVVALDYKERLDTGRLLYVGELIVQENGHHSYGVRAVPYCSDLVSPIDTRLVLWA